MGTDAQRADLYSTVREHWGQQAADTMMALLPPWDYTEVARKVDVELAASRLEAKFGELRAEFGELKGEFGELKGEFGELKGEFGGLRGEFGELKGKVDGQFGRMITVNAGTMLAFGSVVLAAAKFF